MKHSRITFEIDDLLYISNSKKKYTFGRFVAMVLLNTKNIDLRVGYEFTSKNIHIGIQPNFKDDRIKILGIFIKKFVPLKNGDKVRLYPFVLE